MNEWEPPKDEIPVDKYPRKEFMFRDSDEMIQNVVTWLVLSVAVVVCVLGVLGMIIFFSRLVF